jgi:glycosyltransferase involved in cell wall biosynthesis
MFHQNNLVGIVVPVYNKAHMLYETLFSLKSQSYVNFKVVVVDDGSTEDISKIFASFDDDKRFHIIKNSQNIGESASVNKGWAFLNTNYIAIVSSDDPQLPNWLEKMLAFALLNPGFVSYYPNIKIIDEESKELEIVYLPEWDVRLVWEKLICVASAGALHDKTKFPVGFLPRAQNVIYPSDLVQYLRFTLYGENIRVPGILGVWRKSQFGLTKQLTSQLKVVELKQAVRDWFRENLDLQPRINLQRMEANLIGQSWMLFRNEEGRLLSFRLVLREYGVKWFISFRNLFELTKAIFEKFYEKRVENYRND